MGFSESQSALLTEPQLSSVAQPLDLIGETAANLLLEKIKNPDAPTARWYSMHGSTSANPPT